MIRELNLGIKNFVKPVWLCTRITPKQIRNCIYVFLKF